MDDKDWEILAVLYEAKNMTKAAKALYITQPALSFRLKNIERFFGATLMLRGKKGVQFTQEGEYVAQKAREYLKNIITMRDALTNMRTTLSGIIRLGSTNYTTRYFLPRMLRQFREIYPAVEFRVSTGVSKDVFQLVRDNDVHVGFVRGSFPWDGEKVLLFKEKMFVVNKEPFDDAALVSMPRIHYSIAPSNEDMIDLWWNERFASPPVTAMVVDRAETCHELVSQGFGYGILPESVLPDRPNLYCREMVYASGALLERPVWMIYRSESLQLRLVKIFADVIRGLDFHACFSLSRST